MIILSVVGRGSFHRLDRASGHTPGASVLSFVPPALLSPSEEPASVRLPVSSDTRDCSSAT